MKQFSNLKRAFLPCLFVLLTLPAWGQMQPVTKNFRKTPLKNVLKEVEAQTGLSIMYDTRELNLERPVTASFDRTPVSQVLREVLDRGHAVGNHSMHHLQGFKVTTKRYLRDIAEASRLIPSDLYRPPHGIMRWAQSAALKEHFNIVMYDLITRDYSRKVPPEEVLDNVKSYARNGSIIVFHDSLKAERNLRYALPRALDWLADRGFTFARL